ncbi:Pleckstrin homology domain-containing family F member 2, partial [Armadillidium nasatum]
TREEKEAWLSTLFQAISEILRKKSSLRLAFHSAHKSVQDPDLGLKQPILIRTDSVTKCMNCGLQFSVVRRKHHCRACGSVVCSKCSNFKTSLPCEGGKNVRVCRSCHKTLNESEGEMPNSPLSSDLDNKDSLSEAPFSSDLRINSKIENLYLKSRGILEQALTATPMPGFTITRIQNLKCENGLSEKDRDKAFKVYHSKKQYLFLCPTKDEADRWVAVLQKASCAELPPTQ